MNGLVRSDEKAASVAPKGADPIIGTLGDLDLLCDKSVRADAIVHTAFDHDFSR